MLSLVLPTFNEAENLPELIVQIGHTLQGEDMEIIIVDDDSPDRTWEVAEGIARTDPRVRGLRRVGRRGLSSAVVEGFALAKGDVLAVMDSDGQHDPALLTHFLAAIAGGADVVIGSRYMPGGSVGEWVTDRRILSRIGTTLANAVSAVPATDPLSGFFALDRKTYDAVAGHLRPTGFKILLELLAFVPRGTVLREVPLVFRMRRKGESKLSFKVEMEFFWQLLSLSVRKILRRSTGAVAWTFFLFVSALTFGVLLPRVWALRPLYLDSLMRTKAQSALTSFAQTQGFLLSDMTLQSVTEDTLRVLLRFHHRGPDEELCADLDLRAPADQLTPRPCAD